MHPFKNAVNSSNNGNRSTILGNLLLHRSRARANPGFGPGTGVAATHQAHEFLRSGFATAVAALQRHGTANPEPPGFPLIPGRSFNSPLTRFASWGCFINIEVAIAHGGYPLLRFITTRNRP